MPLSTTPAGKKYCTSASVAIETRTIAISKKVVAICKVSYERIIVWPRASESFAC